MLINVKQQTPEWHSLRKSKIGASEAPIIMGDSPWKTPYQLWMEKLGLKEGQIQTAAMKRGLDLEDSVRQMAENALDMTFEPVFAVSDEHYFMAASLDGFNQCNKCAIEIKCPNLEDHSLAMNGKVPAKYMAQLQHQMIVLQIPEIYYCSYNQQFSIVKVSFDEEYSKKLIINEKEFWNDLQELKMPKLSEKDREKRTDEEWWSASLGYINADLAIKKLEQEKELHKKRLMEMSAGKNIEGCGVKLINVARRGNVDYAAIPELQNVDLEKYRKKTSSYVRIYVDGE